MMRVRPLSTSLTLLMAAIVLLAPIVVNVVMAIAGPPPIEKVASAR
jgi:hypothetical protein